MKCKTKVTRSSRGQNDPKAVQDIFMSKSSRKQPPDIQADLMYQTVFSKQKFALANSIRERLGYTMEELQNKEISEFQHKDEPEAGKLMRYEYYNKRRLQKLTDIAREMQKHRKQRNIQGRKTFSTTFNDSMRQGDRSFRYKTQSVQRSQINSQSRGQDTPKAANQTLRNFDFRNDWNYMKTVYLRASKQRIDQLKRNIQTIPKKNIKRQDSSEENQAQKSKYQENIRKRQLEIPQKQRRLEELREIRALRTPQSQPRPRPVENRSIKSVNSSPRMSIRQDETTIEQKLSSINTRINSAMERVNCRKQRIQEKMRIRCASVNRARERSKSLQEENQEKRLRQLSLRMQEHERKRNNRQELMRKTQQKFIDKNSSKKLQEWKKSLKQQRLNMNKKIQQKDLNVSQKLQSIKEEQESLRVLRKVKHDIRLEILKENLSKREKVTQKLKNQIIQKHVNLHYKDQQKNFERSRFLDTRKHEYLKLVEERQRMKAKEEKLKARLYSSLRIKQNMENRWTFFKMMYDEQKLSISNITDILSNLDPLPQSDSIISPSFKVNSMVWSDKHNFFICGCDGGRVRGFSPAEQMFTEMFSISEFGQGRITSIAISKQGKFLVIGTDQGSIKVYSFPELNLIFNIQGLDLLITQLTFADDDSFVLVNYYRLAKVQLLSLKTREVVQNIDLQQKNILTSVITGDGRNIVSGGDFLNLIVSRCDTGKVSGILRGHEGIVNHLLPLSKSGLVISASGDMSIKLWNVDLMECVDTMYGHSRRIVKLSVTSDEKYCISADDQNLILWNLWYRSNIISIPFACSRIQDICISNQYQSIVISDDQGSLLFWDLKETRVKPQRLWAISQNDQKSQLIRLKLDDQGENLYASSQCGKFYSINKLGQQNFSFQAHTDWVRSFHCSKEDNWFITLSDDQRIKIWDMDALVVIFEIEISGWAHYSLYNEFKKLILVALQDNTVELWDLTSRTMEGTFEGHQSKISCMQWLDNQKNRFVTCSYDRTVRVWSLSELKEVFCLTGHLAEIRKVDIDQTGQRIFSASDDRTIRIWSVQEKAQEGVLYGHQDWIHDICLTNDGKFMFSAGKDLTIRIWSIDEQLCVAEIPCNVEMKQIQIDQDNSNLYLSSLKSIYTMSNPLKVKVPQIYPENGEVFMFRNYVTNLINNKPAIYNPSFAQFTILPFRINILHIAAISGQKEHLKQSIKDGALMLSASTGDTPFSLALYKKSTYISEILVKCLPKYIIPRQPKTILSIETLLPTLNANSLPSLHLLYNALFPQSNQKDLKSFVTPRYDLPIVLESDSAIISSSKFTKKTTDMSQEEHVIYRSSLARFDLLAGSTESINFLKSLIICHNDLLFQSQLIQTILELKWRAVRWIFSFQSFIYLLYVAAITLYVSEIMETLPLLILLALLNTLFFMFELALLFTGISDYFTDLVSYPNLIRILCLYLYIFQYFMPILDQEHTQGLYTLLVFLSWINLIHHLQPIYMIRNQLRILKKVILSTWSFLLILMITITTFSFVIYINSHGTYFQALVESFDIMFIQSSIDQNSIIGLIIHLLGAIIIPLLLLNFLISLMVFNYQQQSETINADDWKEIARMVLKIEHILVSRRKQGFKTFIQRCDAFLPQKKGRDTTNKIIQLTQSINRMEGQLASLNEKIDKVCTNSILNRY